MAASTRKLHNQNLAAAGPPGYTMETVEGPRIAATEGTSIFQDVKREELDAGNLQKRNVLSFDGGGIRGYLSILLFQAYCQKLYDRERDLAEKQGRDTPSVSLDDFAKRVTEEKFNLITGTSIGGIIALMLAMKTPVSKVVALFPERGDEIFSKHWLWERVLGQAKYSNAGIKKAAEDLVREAQERGDIDSSIPVSEVRMSHLPLPCALTTYDMNTSRVVVFHNVATAKLTKEQLTCGMAMNSIIYSPDAPVVDVALATSAAPTYFPSHEFEFRPLAEEDGEGKEKEKEGKGKEEEEKGDEEPVFYSVEEPIKFQCIDGGIWANDPRVAAMSLLTAAWKNSLGEPLPLGDHNRLLFCMQSFGTGQVEKSVIQGGGGNTISWLSSSPNIVDVILNASENQVTSVVKGLYQAGLAYHNKIQVTLDPYIELDDTSSLDKQKALVEKLVQDPHVWRPAKMLAVGMGLKAETNHVGLHEMLASQEANHNAVIGIAGMLF